ncbi:hypothetical protein [Sulfitobacter sp. TBRI5]|uniref:hypothetical protein n=1 Tax=Sulfitobacter sp. TBRI5 TaxID=2989732 RepID=UPI003D9B6B9C
MDTKAAHRDGSWFRANMDIALKGANERYTAAGLPLLDTLHSRGAHYGLMTLEVKKTNGQTYRNTDADANWLNDAIKASKWLGYIPFDCMRDQRHASPLIRPPAGHHVSVSAALDISIPDADELEPQIRVYRETDTPLHLMAQPYTLILVGEKSSLEPIFTHLADKFGAAVFIFTGDGSDGLIYEMAKMIDDHGKPAVISYCSDFDPSGFAMPKAVGWKLHLMREIGLMEQEVITLPTALSYEQCVEHDIPSTPIKATDKRAAAWRARWGREQSEIDALATLNPQVLIDAIEADFSPYFDPTLKSRVYETVRSYERRETQRLHDAIGDEEMEAMRGQFDAKLSEIAKQVAELEEAMSISADEVDGFEPEPFELPAAVLNGQPISDPLTGVGWDWLDIHNRMQARKALDDND